MLSSSASSSSATAAAEIVKINSRPLVPGELKRLDKQEKESIVGVVGVVKGRKASEFRQRCCINQPKLVVKCQFFLYVCVW